MQKVLLINPEESRTIWTLSGIIDDEPLDLEMIYTIQFPVLKENEDDTWYDKNGNVVFTRSKGLTGKSVDRPVWEQIRNMEDGETYDHTIEKSELYHGQHITYYAPFTKCDRIEDYRIAWAHFEKEFNNK